MNRWASRRLAKLANRYAASWAGVNVAAVVRREQNCRAAEAFNMEMCWSCEQPHDKALVVVGAVCPYCGVLVIPFA